MSQRPSFLDELKRRKVVRVLLMYGASAFAVLEAADILVPRLGLPDVAFSVILGLIVAGFPVAALVSWFYDTGPDGLERTPDAHEPGVSDHGRGARWLTPGTVVLAAALIGVGLTAGVFATAGLGTADSDAAEITGPPGSIAVLPFQNLSPDPDAAYFSDGLAEEIRNVLARVDGLRVAARSSAAKYADGSEDAREVAKLLGVAALLSGTVRRDAGQVRVSVELVGGADGFQIWSDGYQREMADVFDIQEDIAQRVVAEIQPEVAQSKSLTLPGMERRLVERPTDDPEAYEDFLRARYLFHQRTAESLEESIQLYERALERDPEFVEAMVGLAMVWWVLPGYAPVDLPTALEEARSRASAALVLDQNQALAHAVLGSVYMETMEWSDAVESFSRALELAPDDPSTLLWSAELDLEMGYVEEARTKLDRAASVDPSSGVVAAWRGQIAFLDGDVERGLALNRRAEALSWGNALAVRCLMYEVYELERDPADVCDEASTPPDILFAETAMTALRDGDAARFVELLGPRVRGERPRMSANPVWSVHWSPLHRDVLSTPAIVDHLTALGLPEAWDAHGWPDLCRRTGEDSFNCG